MDIYDTTLLANHRLSSIIWGIAWEKCFPIELHTDPAIVVELATYDAIQKFTQENFATIYQENPQGSPFLWLENSPAKAKFYQATGDFFSFKSDGKTVGVFVGTVQDWSTYYLRSTGLLPSFQGFGIFQKFLLHFLNILREYNVVRAEADVSPSNLINVHVLNKMGFNVSGTSITDRWGALIHFTKFLQQKNEHFFLHQFCHGVRPQLEGAMDKVKNLETDERRTP